jgi:transposase InsO family protein
MNREIRMRLKWVRLYEQTGNAGLVCLRCGISRPTLRKWLRRYQGEGIEGLRSRSRRPKSSPGRKVFAAQELWILDLRSQRKLGARRLQNELRRHHDCALALSTIHKVLVRHKVEPLPRRRKHRYKRYERPIPGDRVQMDTCKIAAGLYQFTAIDDCTRYRVMALYPMRTAKNTLRFLEKVIEEMPFPIQRIQSDRGREFFAYKVQERLMRWGIKFRPVKPRSPHLNGKVERSQRTDLDEFYSTVPLDSPNLTEQLQEWQHFYNWDRATGAFTAKPQWNDFWN